MYLDKRAIKPTVAVAQATSPMDSFFNPRSIAIVGASSRPESVGYQVLQNVINAGFTGSIYPVNHKRGMILGLEAYSSLSEIDDDNFLVIIATPAPTIPAILEQCWGNDIHQVVIITAGFGELGEEGKALQQEILEIARRNKIRIIGPNCLGIIRPSANLNATFGDSGIKDGGIALLSQSGAVCTGVLDFAKTEGIGFSTVVSLGAAADTDFGEFLEYLATDEKTKSVVMYIESIQDGPRFISGLQACSDNNKPVIMIKSGRTESGGKSAASHTGAMVSNDKVFDAAIDLPGVTRIYSVSELFAAVKVLSKDYEPLEGHKLAIITNAGGPGVMAADRAEDAGVSLSQLGQASIDALNKRLPSASSTANPIDVLGDATSERYAQTLEVVTQDPNVDGILILLTPQSGTDVENIARVVIKYANLTDMPILASFIGGDRVKAGRDLFNGTNVCCFDTPEQAIDAFSYLPEQAKIPAITEATEQSSVYDAHVQWLFNTTLDDGRNILTTEESKEVLSLHDISVSSVVSVTTAIEAAEAAKKIGYPVAVKVNMADFSHKSDIGGVILNLKSRQEVKVAFCAIRNKVLALEPERMKVVCSVEPFITSKNGRELMIGVVRDPVFGHAISFGLGGTMVEVLQDNAIALAPLTVEKIEKLIAKTKAARYLQAFRNMPAVNKQALIDVLMNVSKLVTDFPEIESLDINPLVADEHDCIALDARILL